MATSLPADLARHFRKAVSCGGLDRAVTWALRAAAADRSALALSRGRRHLRRLRAAVADAGARAGRRPDRRRPAGRGGRCWPRRVGPPTPEACCGAARAAADRAGDAVRTARVALAVAALGSRFASRRDESSPSWRRRSPRWTAADAALEAQLTAALARELQHSVPEQRARPGHSRSRRCVAGSHEPATATSSGRACWPVTTCSGRRAQAVRRAEVVAELVALAGAGGDLERHAEALLLHANALLESGRAAFGPDLEMCLELLDGLGQPRHLYTIETRRACVALLRGGLDEADARIEQAAVLGERLREPDTGNVRMSQRLELVRARGLPEELAAFAAEAVAHWTGAPVHAHAVAAGFCARAGDLESARHHVGRCARPRSVAGRPVVPLVGVRARARRGRRGPRRPDAVRGAARATCSRSSARAG